MTTKMPNSSGWKDCWEKDQIMTKGVEAFDAE
jgi:hypothetical protein